MTALLRGALTASADPAVCRLPADVAELLLRAAAPPRLAAHLRVVHDVAVQLIAWLVADYPGLILDRDAVLFGAATHDLGKIIVTKELSAPGSEHERAGQRLLLDEDIEPRLARFAATHSAWNNADIELEDLLVSVADKIWKAKRVPELEQLIIDRLATASAQEPWQVFLSFDEELGRLAAGADSRLEFHNSYPIACG